MWTYYALLMRRNSHSHLYSLVVVSLDASLAFKARSKKFGSVKEKLCFELIKKNTARQIGIWPNKNERLVKIKGWFGILIWIKANALCTTKTSHKFQLFHFSYLDVIPIELFKRYPLHQIRFFSLVSLHPLSSSLITVSCLTLEPIYHLCMCPYYHTLNSLILLTIRSTPYFFRIVI